MKKVFLFIVCCASTVMLFAQQNQTQRRYPPTSVERSWQRDYPGYDNNNNDEPWQWRNNRWQRRFRDRDNRQVEVYYDRYGRRVYAMQEWNRDDVPVVVRERVRKRYRSENYNVYRIERPGRGFYFQISLGNNRNVYLDSRGREVRHSY